MEHWINALIALIKNKNHVAINSEENLDEIFCAIYDTHHRRCVWWRAVESATGMSANKFAETSYRKEAGKLFYPVSFPTLQHWLDDRNYTLNPEKRKQIKDA